MAENSKIAWTTHTFNPWIGCTKVAAGCVNCYAEADMDKRRGRVKWGPNGTRSKTSEAYWRKPIAWNREAAALGVRPRVFCASLADVFEDWDGWVLDASGNCVANCINCGGRQFGSTPGLPPHCAKCRSHAELATLNDLRRDLFALIDATPNLDWLLLTKRPENIRRMWAQPMHLERATWPGKGRPNVHLGTSVSNQPDADKNVPELLKCRDLSPVLFVSAEPLLGRVDFRRLSIPGTPEDSFLRPIHECRNVDSLRGESHHPLGTGCLVYDAPAIDQVILGIESNGSRVGRLGEFTTEDEWNAAAAEIVSQCREAGVAAFVKQIPKGGKVEHDLAKFPPELQYQEFPEVCHETT